MPDEQNALTKRAQLSAAKQALLAKRLRGEAKNQAKATGIEKRGETGPAPLSFAQERLWFLDQLEPGSPAYNIPLAIQLHGPLDAAALHSSINLIVARHEVLRTTFQLLNERPIQVIAPSLSVPLPLVDLSELTTAERETEIQRRVAVAAQQPFDLAAGPLLRGEILRLEDQHFIVLLTLHHIIADGWSMSILVRELSAFYHATINGQADREATLPALPIQYADYAQWQRQWLQGEVLERQLSYWRQQLTGAPALLELPTDFPRPATQTFAGSRQSFVLPPDLATALTSLSQAQGCTLFMTLLAAFQLLLARLSGQDEIVVGTPIAGRTRPEVEPLIGFFVNTLVLRADLRDNLTFTQLLTRVRETTLGAFAHQDLPFEHLVEALQPQRNLSYSPIFQVMFVLQNTPSTALELPEIRLSPLHREQSVTKFDLTLTMETTPEAFFGLLEYKTDLFEATTITRIIGHFKTLLHAIAADPQQHVAQLPLLASEEQQQILSTWNATHLAYPAATGIHQMFEAQAARTPEAVAVVYEEQALTYADLNRRANQLAHYLMQGGVRPGDLVGLYLERSIELIIGVLGILKAGAAYVPLDPSHPTERLRFMLEDAQVSALVTQELLRDRLAVAGLTTIALDADWPAVAQQPDYNPERQFSADQPAYVIYTSGSTGRPKGVLIQHRSVLNLSTALYHTIFTEAPDRPLRLSLNGPLAFDTSVKQLLQLMHGHCLYIVPSEVRQDVVRLHAFIRDNQLDVLDCTPSLLRLLLDEGLADQVGQGPKLVLIGGEAIDEQLWQRLAQSETTHFYNVYGPTECTVNATVQRIEPSTTPTIGRPLPNMQVYVLDRQLQPVPIGVAGELYIGGAGVGLGYIHRPDLTAARFVPDPFSQRSGARLYRTGDRVQYLPDGKLKFLGRLDHQVKLRGFRIELGEIETALSQHEAVRHAVITLHVDRMNNQHLIGYVVVDGSPAPSSQDLQVFLQAYLPAYMIPSAIVILDHLPLTPNGKLDRAALPAPEEHGETTDGFVAPTTPLQAVLAAIWADLLGRSAVGIHDNFFALGGHSLLATQLAARVRQTLQVALPLRVFFDAPTIALLAAAVAQHQRAATELPELPLVPQPRPAHLPLSFAQERLWFLDQLEPNTAIYNIPVTLRLHGPLHVDALRASLQLIVARHEVLQTHFRVVDGQPTQVIDSATTLALPVHDLAALPAELQDAEVQRAATAVAEQPFDLAHGPLVRASLLHLHAAEHVLLFCVHHSLADGWSLGILSDELNQAYHALSRGATPQLPALPLQYADYALWQRQWLSGAVLEHQRRYWQQQLAALPTLALPTDYPRPPVQTFAGATHSFHVPTSVSQALTALSQRHSVTVFMTLLGAFTIVLQRYSGQDEIVVGTPIAGRTHPEVEPLIGFFVNTLVLRTDLRGQPTVAELLARVRSTTLDAYAHQDLPFEQVVELLQPARDASRAPLFQIMFTLQTAPRTALALGDITVSGVARTGVTSKFDLTLALEESADGLAGSLEYNRDLFAPATIARLAQHLTTLLHSLAADAQRPIAQLTMLPADERHLLLHEWNSATVSLPAEESLHQLVAAQVARTPHAVAVVEGAQEWTYAALNARANQLAHYLRAHGAGPEVLVGIALPRTADLVVAILAVLKTGAAYVPLDPAYPQDRLAFMLADAQAPLLVTQAEILPQLHTPTLVRIELDGLAARLAQQPTQDLAVEVDSAQLAYVIYTSGSTGRPKGVAITHASARTLLAWAHATFAPEQLAGVLAATSICFDLSIFELFAPLSCGGAVLLADDLLQLPTLPARHAVTLVNTVPSVLAALLTLEPLPPQVTTVNLAGEPLPLPLVQQLYAQPTIQAVYNLYGPTEDTTYSTATCVPADATAVTIGRPLPNSQAYLLDALGQPVPLGVVGELYFGGDGLARGYLNRPALTAEKFVPDPFAGTPGARLYRTGDLARYRADGQIEYLGRIDHQVKIRGFRIELGEIEAVLAQQPGVHAAVVVARRTATSEPRLVAYLVPQAGVTLERGAIQQALAAHLPAYMQPSAWMMLDTLPLTPSGKVDRKALPEPQEHVETTDGFVAPTTPLQAVLATIWADLLGRSAVSIHDNFFALGGHSLLATQLAARVRQTLQVALPLRVFFDAPTIALLAAAVAQHQRAATELPELPLVPQPRPAHLPLSFAQERLWFLDQLEPNTATYNIPVTLRLHGPLHVDALRASLQLIVARHEVLQTHFRVVDGQPTQVIDPSTTLALPVHDLAALSAELQDAEVQRAATAVAEQPFDLAHGPLVRASLLHLHAAEHVLLFCVHHSLADGWSLGILSDELNQAYHALSRGATPQLPELPLQYADYALWQRQWLSGAVLEHQRRYWQQQLAALPTLALPTDYPRPPVQTFAGATHSFHVPTSVSQALTALSQRHSVTVFMTLLSAFTIVLQRYSGQDDIVVGTPIAGRTHPEVEPLIGFFVNTLVLRTDLRGQPTVAELLARVRSTTLDAYAHQDLPFEQVVELLQPARDASRAPLFQVMFTLQTAPRTALALGDITVSGVARTGVTSKFDLTLALEESADGLAGSLEYNRDLFAPSTIARLAQHLTTLLHSLAADAQRPIAQLTMLPAAERHLLLHDWNATSAPYPSGSCLHHLFEAQVARTPAAVAVVEGDRQWTYTELNVRANQLAHYLRTYRIGPDMLVGVCMERSLELVVALLGILKAGAGYVPLDPDYPQERLTFMLQDAQVPLLLTQSHLRERLPDTTTPAVVIDQEWPTIATAPYSPLITHVTSDNLAYVIYTSGSTGRPKGVAISHAAICNHMHWMQDAFGFTSDDRVLQKTPLSFDASVWEFYAPLFAGGQLVMAQPGGHHDMSYLITEIQRQQITTLQLVPSVLRLLLDTPGLEHCTSLRRLYCGGEALTPGLIEQVYARLDVEMYNLYGPTEAAIDATFYPCPRDRSQPLVPIGRPIANTQIYLLDPTGQPVPVGITGELYIGGLNLARGYLNRPDLTAEKFVPHPFADQLGARLYRTGDLARYRADGQIEYLGRIDDQIKLRGLRIELSEIEAVLAQLPGVREVVVLVHEDRTQNQQLVAYLVGNEHELATGELRAALKQQLPEYMIPGVFIVLPEFPHTPNGKVDRKALPAPERSNQEHTSVSARDALELELVRIWEDVLHVPAVGIHDDFFALGGHSLVAIRLFSQIEQRLGVKLPLTTLFQTPTIEHLATVLRQQSTAPQAYSPLVALQPHGSKPPMIWVHPGGGNVFAYVELARHLGQDQPFYGLQARGLDGEQEPLTQIEAMASAYREAVRSLQPHGPYLLGGWSMGGVVAFELAQQLLREGETVDLLVLADTWAPRTADNRPEPDPDLTAADELALLASFAQDLGLSQEQIAIPAEQQATLTLEEGLTYVLERTRQLNLLPPTVDLLQLRQLFDVFKANVQARMHYRVYEAYPARLVLLNAAESLGREQSDATLGWTGLAAEIEVQTVPGNHFTMMRDPHVQALAQRLQVYLDEVSTRIASTGDA